MSAMTTIPNESDFQRLPIQPEDGFPQAFLLSFEGKLYRFTFSVSFLTLEPFKIWEAGGGPTAERMLRRSLSLPLSSSGARVQLPWELHGEPERMIYVLPQENLYLVMKLEREDLPEGERMLGITRPVLGIPVRVGDLVFLFKKIHIARGNLLGPGNFGSEVMAGVAAYGG
jgi:hypothetical protein